MQTSQALGDGTLFAGRYRVTRKIAAGGMGTVYEAIHVETGRARALKVMHAHLFQSEEMRERFRREAQIASQVVSEYIVDVLDAGIDEGSQAPFLVMELLQGEDLGQRLKRVGKLTPAETLTILKQVGLALDKTHASSIVHRDLKPDNVFLTARDDGSIRVKIFDFGVAKLVAESATSAGATRSLGTPLYMAPEQFRVGSRLLPAADIYALGMMAYTLLVGKPYWAAEAGNAGDVIAFAMAVVLGPQESAVRRAAGSGVTLPPGFDPWFAKVTAPAAEDRYPTASEAIAALAAALTQAPSQQAFSPTAPQQALSPASAQQALSPAAPQQALSPAAPQQALSPSPRVSAQPVIHSPAPTAQQPYPYAQSVVRSAAPAPVAQPPVRPTVPLASAQPIAAPPVNPVSRPAPQFTPQSSPDLATVALAPSAAALEPVRKTTLPLSELPRVAAAPAPLGGVGSQGQRLSSAPPSAAPASFRGPAPVVSVPVAAPRERSRAPLFVAAFLTGLFALTAGAWLLLRRPASAADPTNMPVSESATAAADSAPPGPTTATLGTTSAAESSTSAPSTLPSTSPGASAEAPPKARPSAAREPEKPGTSAAPKPTSPSPKPTSKPLLGRD